MPPSAHPLPRRLLEPPLEFSSILKLGTVVYRRGKREFWALRYFAGACNICMLDNGPARGVIVLILMMINPEAPIASGQT